MEKQTPDLLWKEIIEDLFEDFLRFFMTDLYSNIDFAKGYQFLDNELANIVDKTIKGKKLSDRLVKVHLKDGTENWILVHLEVQGYYEKEFSERMFKYFYRIYDKYSKKIVAFAIFTEDRKDYQPAKFDYSFYETELNYKYKTYKILDQKEEKLLASDNPFALVVLAGLYQLKGEQEGKEKKLEFKEKLFDLLTEKGYSRKKVYMIFKFLDGLLYLPDELEDKFYQDINEKLGGADKLGISEEMTNLYQTAKNKGKLEMVKNLLDLHVELDKIVAASGLSKEEIEEIKKKARH
ncbi:hypothetical protein U472_00615 [Orenia metallireducens]|uniref:Transposase (putative) YhgA-like domain-containing protein n=1 Tax=Orenia metallireducens TaxID=1413210 RepID=A0A1C0AD86_9FIRM|nr:Rpn family recombination-promoting nuclease/putative transposase [Orenia metallireducens]OCL28603.1 hypothetical protein U472_00615 [Orenia metallireducens]